MSSVFSFVQDFAQTALTQFIFGAKHLYLLVPQKHIPAASTWLPLKKLNLIWFFTLITTNICWSSCNWLAICHGLTGIINTGLFIFIARGSSWFSTYALLTRITWKKSRIIKITIISVGSTGRIILACRWTTLRAAFYHTSLFTWTRIASGWPTNTFISGTA